jgi:hypothetical protein
MGIGADGPRVLNFAPVIRMNDIPLNTLIRNLMTVCSEKLGGAVEIEFAMVLDHHQKCPSRFSFLQVRPMVVSDASVEIIDSDFVSDKLLLASEKVLGNGTICNLTDVVYVKPDDFQKEHTRTITGEIDTINKRITAERRQYVLIGFGRWGSSDPWLGIPVDWSNISGVRVIVEATLPEMHVELSQGSHFFHNLTSLQLCYFSVPHTGSFSIDWKWLQRQETNFETKYVRHVRLETPLTIKVDGRHSKGVILK